MTNLCIIFPVPGDNIHKVEFEQTGKNMFEVPLIIIQKFFALTFEFDTMRRDAVANDVTT